ncbi:amino acid permease [Streptomyces sp. NPDC057445]|uniref:amino acid permease n=1 Tax=Streptomyces sp. NPDC057445 TaxID=3346136 RepID=UPI00368B6A3E
MALLSSWAEVVPGHVTLLAQLTASAFGTGWAYYAISLLVTLVLGIAANTSFGGLPVLMSLLAKDDRLPHLFALRSERPVHRWGVAALAMMAGALLIVVSADTQRLIPLYAIGVLVGFTISQIGLVRHWLTQRPDAWLPRVLINGIGAVLTAVAGIVLLTTKFLAGAWIVVLIVPLLMLLFSRIERYYTLVENELRLDRTPPRPTRAHSLVIVPLGGVDAVAVSAVNAAYTLGEEVVVVAVFTTRRKPTSCATPTGRGGTPVYGSKSSTAPSMPWCIPSSTTSNRPPPTATTGGSPCSSRRWNPCTAATGSSRTNEASSWPAF